MKLCRVVRADGDLAVGRRSARFDALFAVRDAAVAHFGTTARDFATAAADSLTFLADLLTPAASFVTFSADLLTPTAHFVTFSADFANNGG